MTGEKLNVLVVGVGEIARRIHVPYLFENRRMLSTAIHDIDWPLAQRTAREFRVRAVRSEPERLGADVLVVCTPPASHAGIVVRALECGADVIVEKPLALSSRDAERIAEASRKNGRWVFPCYTNRFRNDVETLRDLLLSGEVGKVRQISAHWTRRSGVPGTQGGIEAGVLWDLGSHLVDIGLWLTNWSGKVTAFSSSEVSSYESAQGDTSRGWYQSNESGSASGMLPESDTISGMARFPDGTLYVLASWNYHGANDEVYIRVAGTRGVAELRTVFGFSPDRRTIAPPCLRVSAGASGKWTTVIHSQSRAPIEYKRQLDLAYSRHTSASQRKYWLQVAVRSVALCEAFARSMELDQSVCVQL